MAAACFHFRSFCAAAFKPQACVLCTHTNTCVAVCAGQLSSERKERKKDGKQLTVLSNRLQVSPPPLTTRPLAAVWSNMSVQLHECRVQEWDGDMTRHTLTLPRSLPLRSLRWGLTLAYTIAY